MKKNDNEKKSKIQNQIDHILNRIEELDESGNIEAKEFLLKVVLPKLNYQNELENRSDWTRNN